MHAFHDIPEQLTLTVKLKVITTSGEIDRNTRASFHPVMRAKSRAPSIRERREMKSGIFSLDEVEQEGSNDALGNEHT